jgi:CRP-like cAMP-binding protein
MDGDLLARHILGLLQPEDLELLLNLGFRRAYERGDMIRVAGEEVDRFYLVEEGLVRLDVAPPEGPRFLRPGQVFGSTSLLLQRLSPYNVVAQEDVIVIALTGKELDWLIEAEPAAASSPSGTFR